MGRDTKYKKEYVEQAKKLCLLGAIDKDIADFFGVGVTSLDRWKKAHKEFKQALKQGKEIADAKVVKSLYLRATGYDHPDLHFASYEGDIFSEEYTKHIPPDVTACIFWLKNRDSANWRDAKDMNIGGQEGNLVKVIVFDGTNTKRKVHKGPSRSTSKRA